MTEKGLPPHLWLSKHRVAVVPHAVWGADAHVSPMQYARLADQAQVLGIRIIQVWEDLWHTKRPIIQSRLLSVTGQTKRIYARNTEVAALPGHDMDAFLKDNHLLGPATARYRYCLMNNGVPVAAATFSKPRSIPRNHMMYRSYELIRFCSVLGSTVTGGLDKLLQHFIRQHHPDDIMTYADRDWGKGKAYLSMGFDAVETTDPVSFIVEPISWQRLFPGKLHRYLRAKGWKLEKNASPADFLRERGYGMSFNAGNVKYLKLLKW